MDRMPLELGTALPPLPMDEITRTTLALFAGASGDHHPIHIDIDYARRAGFDDVFVHGMLVMSYLGRHLDNISSALRHFDARFVAITEVHEALVCTGLVEQLVDLDGECCAQVALAVMNEAGQLKVSGSALIAIK